jgi:integrase
MQQRMSTIVNTEETASITLEDAVGAFMAEKSTEDLSKVHLRNLRGKLKIFARRTGSKMHLHRLDRKHLITYLEKVGTNRTKINHISAIKMLLGWGKKAGYIPRSQVLPTDDLPDYRIKSKEPEFYTPAEMRRLMTAAANLPRKQGGVTALVILGGFCGLRTEEIKRMMWSHVDLESAAIKMGVGVTKSARRRVVEMPANAVEWMRALIAGRNLSGPIIPYNWWENIHRLTSVVAQAAGVPWKLNGLRHSYATYAMAHYKNLAYVAEQMGNTPGIIKAHYQGLALTDEGAEWFNITPSILQ